MIFFFILFHSPQLPPFSPAVWVFTADSRSSVGPFCRCVYKRQVLLLSIPFYCRNLFESLDRLQTLQHAWRRDLPSAWRQQSSHVTGNVAVECKQVYYSGHEVCWGSVYLVNTHTHTHAVISIYFFSWKADFLKKIISIKTTVFSSILLNNNNWNK